MRRYAWLLVIGGLAVAGVVLAVADISTVDRWPNPLTQVMVGPAPHVRQQLHAVSFDRTQVANRLVLESPIVGFGPLNPYLALRTFLTSGAGLVLLALGALIVLPGRARNAIERLEARHGAEISLGAGLLLVLLMLAAVTLLRFTLLFLAAVPLVLVAGLVAALFGIACISLALGRLVRRALRLPTAHPLVAALAGALVIFDLAVVPYAGVFAFAAVAIAGIGLAVVTRFGSTGGWSFVDLDW